MDTQPTPFMPSPAPTSPIPVQPMASPPVPRSVSWALWAILALVVVLGIGVYAWMQFRSAEEEQPTPSASVAVTPTPSGESRETFTSSTGLFSISAPAGFQSDARYAPNMFLTQKNDTGKTLVNAWDIEIGTPGTLCATDAACFQILKASFDGAREAGSTVEYREVTAIIAGRSVKGFEAWDANAVRYTFPFSHGGTYFTAHIEINNVAVNDAAFRADSLASVQAILATLTFAK